MVSQEKVAQLRDTLREILESFHQDNLEETVIAIVSAARIAFTIEDEAMKRHGTFAALQEGMTRCQTIKSQCYSRFHVNFPWQTKAGQDLLEFLASVPEEQTVDKFAEWWEKNDWRGKQHQPPTLQQIYEFWPCAFAPKPYQQLEIFRAEEDN